MVQNCWLIDSSQPVSDQVVPKTQTQNRLWFPELELESFYWSRTEPKPDPGFQFLWT
jgi:hypothetical protein